MTDAKIIENMGTALALFCDNNILCDDCPFNRGLQYDEDGDLHHVCLVQHPYTWELESEVE